MIISNSFRDYTQEDLQKITEYIHTMEDYAKKTIGIYSREVVKSTPSQDNVVYIFPHIKANFLKMKNDKLLIHEVVAVYLEWHEEMLLLTSKNVGQYTNIKVLQHIDELMTICKTFSSLFRNMKS